MLQITCFLLLDQTFPSVNDINTVGQFLGVNVAANDLTGQVIYVATTGLGFFSRLDTLGRETDLQFTHNGQVVRRHLVLDDLIREGLHTTDAVVADNMVDYINAFSPCGRFHIGMEGEVLLQRLRQHAALPLRP